MRHLFEVNGLLTRLVDDLKDIAEIDPIVAFHTLKMNMFLGYTRLSV